MVKIHTKRSKRHCACTLRCWSCFSRFPLGFFCWATIVGHDLTSLAFLLFAPVSIGRLASLLVMPTLTAFHEITANGRKCHPRYLRVMVLEHDRELASQVGFWRHINFSIFRKQVQKGSSKTRNESLKRLCTSIQIHLFLLTACEHVIVVAWVGCGT